MDTFATSDGRILSYQRAGSGPLLVMVPGGPGMDPETYFDSANIPGREQLILCPRGTGASDPPFSPEGYHVAGYVADVEELRRHLGEQQLTLYGSSHGGTVALAYAGAHPERVARLVLVNGPARLDDGFTQGVAAARTRFAAQLSDGAARLATADAAGERLNDDKDEDERRRDFRALMRRYVAHLGAAERAYLARLTAAPMNYAAVAPMYEELLGGLDLLVNASKIDLPVLVLGSELDVTVPAEHMRAIAQALPDARFVELEGVGHFVEVEAHERWIELVTLFLEG
jgi:proline iminopeptidase